MRKLQLCAVLLIASTPLAQADGDGFSIDTRFGSLKAARDSRLQFNGRTLSPTVIGPGPANIVSNHRLASSDVILISQPSGTACPGNFVFVTLSATASTVSPPFGTCYDDTPRPVQKGESIIVLLKKADGTGVTQFIYENGAVREERRPSQR